MNYVDMMLYGAYAIGGMWLVLGLARFQVGWEKSQSRTATLRFALQNNARLLLQNLKDIEKLEVEIERTKKTAATARQDQEDRRHALTKALPPPPGEIYVTSEFPASQKDVPWVVDIGRDDKAAARQIWDREPQPSLFWSPTHQAAAGRAQQVAAEFKGCHVKGVRRFFDELAPKE
jgi:hypothetical protein